MTFAVGGEGPELPGVQVPREFYWVLTSPVALAGMRFPRNGFPWSAVGEAGFSRLVALEPGFYDPSPLTLAFNERLEDLVRGDPPRDPELERKLIGRAVLATVGALRAGQGVVVHCAGGRGRSGTVIGCVLRVLGYQANEILGYLDHLHKLRGKPGWPEVAWQATLVQEWDPDAQQADAADGASRRPR